MPEAPRLVSRDEPPKPANDGSRYCASGSCADPKGGCEVPLSSSESRSTLEGLTVYRVNKEISIVIP